MVADPTRQTESVCRLCDGFAATYTQVECILYQRCEHCGVIQREADSLPDALFEWQYYQTHENRASDPGYCRFLGQLAKPLAERLASGARGLDYGAGPDSALPVLLAELGLDLRSWDPLYQPDSTVLAHRYDFITCTEAAEHFHRPGREFDRIAALLRPGGWLGLMTELWLDQGRFGDWYYLRDPTHVCFYTPQTLEYLAAHYGWRLDWHDQRVVIFQACAGEPQISRIDGD